MLVLASNSPRRRELLALGGWDFVVLPAQVDERVGLNESPGAYVQRLAEAKAMAAARLLDRPEDHTLVLAADTAVVDDLSTQNKDGPKTQPSVKFEILGKPGNTREAEKMLRRLRGRVHQVYTGLALLRPSDNYLLSQICVTEVPMRCYSDQEMLDYIATGDAFDKAGAYAIQHPDFRPVQELNGCFANVMGLPVCEVARMLAQFKVFPGGDIIQTCSGERGSACVFLQHSLGQTNKGKTKDAVHGR